MGMTTLLTSRPHTGITEAFKADKFDKKINLGSQPLFSLPSAFADTLI